MKKTKPTSKDDMVVATECKRDTPLVLPEIIEELKEYLTVQRGGYWEHADHATEMSRIKRWHRAIDAAIFILSVLQKQDILGCWVRKNMLEGNYPKYMPSAKNLEMEKSLWMEMAGSRCPNDKKAKAAKPKKTVKAKGKK